MAKKTLVIDGTQPGRFFLSIADGTLSLGGSAEGPDGTVPNLRIASVRCEIEIEDDEAVFQAPTTEEPRPLEPGQTLELLHMRVHFERGPVESASPTEAAPSEAGASRQVHKQLRVIDGANQGNYFVLPESGSTTVGKSSKHAEIILHDLYVSRVHCEFEVQGDSVFVKHIDGENGTRVNGTRITQRQELRLGDVVRVGNSHLRLEPAGTKAAPTEPPPKPAFSDSSAAVPRSGATPPSEPKKLPVFSAEQLMMLEGHMVSHYRLEALVGYGQSGVMFRALDLKNNHHVGFKVLAPEFPASAAELTRFAYGLRPVSNLQHDHLVSLHGAGKTGPYAWLVREYVEGESAAQAIHRLKEGGKPSWTRALRIAVHLGRALEFLHENRIVHGNVTPNNILLRAADKTTKLADLMFAKAIDGSELQQAKLEKKLLAELPYLAPEQVEPNTSVDHLADLYALGAVVYALLTGRPPYWGASPEETLALIEEGNVVKPSRVQRGIPVPLEAAVLKLLAKQQENRYATATELLADLELLAREEAIVS